MEKKLEFAKNARKRHNTMLKEKYQKKIVPEMMKQFGYKNNMAVPMLEKVVVNTGFGKKMSKMTGKQAEKFCSLVASELALITGQKPVFTKAKKSISEFSLAKGNRVGAKVTLRKKRMYDFLDRLINTALPRSRDFRGLPEKSIDGSGNLSIGIKEHIAFPETEVKNPDQIFGLQVIAQTNTKDREKALTLFKLMGFPIQK